MNEKSSLTQPVAFCDEVAGSVAKGRAAGVAYLGFSKGLTPSPRAPS